MIAQMLSESSKAAARMGSPLYAAIYSLAESDADRGLLDSFLSPERLALSRPGVRFMGALHYLALSGAEPSLAAHFPSCGGDGDPDAAWSAARGVIARRPDDVARLFARTPQTNEPARSMPLLGALLTVAHETEMPVRLFEVGTSAGLNLRFDAYRYEGASWKWGGRSPLVLHNRERSGTPKHLDANLRIAERGGCDLHPLDIQREADRLELLSFVWADQLDRIARLRSAMEAAAAIPVVIDSADAVEWLGKQGPKEQYVTVLFHSVMFEHLSPQKQREIVAQIAGIGERASASAPVAWVRLEEVGSRYETSVTLWPSKDEITVARSDGHAQNIEWLS